ncbi:hypothetical protein LVO39_005597 [Salmonella enterica]|nr:hypothetical protein [Salmonella enterica]ECD7245031.1 hypothetical protein [Salmonella enterica subsp. enterica serovar Florida]EJI0210079.1 hypothetical protein [Salmonella enterica subsp. enterica]ECF4168426.1 hypothetical protein [Salmonella enterica subsp. enterica serovar Florida]EEU9073094.1 hypothetical protein [Salmonella enterica]EFP1523533.1 hypothetical protein [Salmonella enterica]
MSYENYISETNIRKCQFYVRYMESRRRSGISIRYEFDWDSESGNTSEICRWINTELDDCFQGHERDIDAFVREMESACKDELLPLTDFEWVKDKRICLWVWHNEIGYRNRRNETFPGHSGRFDALIKYFDKLNCSGVRKKEILDELRGDWQRNGNTPDPFANENAEIINYLWCYSIKLHDNITRYFSPISDEDRKICLTGFYDCILNTPEKKELFLKKIKSALSSHKHREKAGKGNINKRFLLSLENDNKLNDMISSENMKRDDFMNRLIAEEHERRKVRKDSLK